MKTLMLNWLYYPPVGHVVEALKLTKGYALANKDLEIHLIINASSPIELAEACPWIKKVYVVPVDSLSDENSKTEFLKDIPKEWDYIITDDRSQRLEMGDWSRNLIWAHKLLKEHLTANMAQGYIRQTHPMDKEVLPRVLNPEVFLYIPSESKAFAQSRHVPEKSICVMLGGSAGLRQSPSVSVWLKICKELVSAIPDLKIYFTGVTKSENGRTSTKDFTDADVDYLINNLPNAEKVYNVGLWNQLSLIQECEMFLSPHTGFAFLAPLVGTKWLEIGTCAWPTYLFNDIPFYSVLPDCGSYPSKEKNNICGKLLSENKKSLCVTDENLEKKIPEIVHGAKLLFDETYTYERAMREHLEKINTNYDHREFFFFGGLDAVFHL